MLENFYFSSASCFSFSDDEFLMVDLLFGYSVQRPCFLRLAVRIFSFKNRYRLTLSVL